MARRATDHNTERCAQRFQLRLEDLNSAIKNLRRCFGFPYQEYIGPAARSIFFGGSSSVLCATLRYMNTLTHQYRTRSEHEDCADSNLIGFALQFSYFGSSV